MNRIDLILIILVPAMCLFSLIVLPWLYFIYQPLKFLYSVILVAICLVATLILLIRKGYPISTMVNILLGSIFSLAGYSVFIFGAFHSFNIVFILIEVVLSIVGIALSFVLLKKNPPQEKPRAEEPIIETIGEEIPTYYVRSTKQSGSIRRTLRIWRDPIMYFVIFAVAGIIFMFIYRPIPVYHDILGNLLYGAAFGMLGACCFIGSGRTKIVRK